MRSGKVKGTVSEWKYWAGRPELERAAKWVHESGRLEALVNGRPSLPAPWEQMGQAYNRRRA
jgi:hypothetical protein